MSASIVRTWSGVAAAADAEAYLTHLQRDTIPSLRRLDGFEGIRVLRRAVEDRVEFVVMTTWSSLDAIRAFAGDELAVAVVPAAAQSLLLSFDPEVEHYETAIDE